MKEHTCCVRQLYWYLWYWTFSRGLFNRKDYYEGRLAKIELNEAEKPRIDPEFEDVTEDEEESSKEKLKSKWARLEALVGADKRVRQVANDIVEHFETRDDSIEGKGMIVCMSRRICA